MTGLANLPTISTETDARPSAVDEAEGGTVPPSSATPLATLPSWGERRHTGRGPWRPFDGSEPDVDHDTGDERATSDAEGRAG